jgi:hypothetical protein
MEVEEVKPLTDVSDKDRFIMDLEFVQALSNTDYLARMCFSSHYAWNESVNF